MATSVASAMLLAGMAMPSLAVNSATEVRYSEKYLSTPSISVDLKDGEVDLSRDELASLVSGRYNTTLVSVVDETGKTVTSGNVGTGYKATLGNGKVVTVVLYGDVNQDGAVDLRDADMIYDAFEKETTLSGAIAKAADVSADSTMDLRDADQIYAYYDQGNGYVADLNKLPEQEVQVLGQYNVTLEDQYVNNRNEKAVKGMLTVNPELTEEVKDIYFYAVNDNGDLVGGTPLAGPVTMAAYTSKVPITLDTTEYASMPDGVNTIKAIVAGASGANYSTGEVLATFTIEKHTEEIDKAKIVGLKGERPASVGENAGKVSFEIQSDVKIVKAYYVVVEDETTPTYTSIDTNDFIDNNRTPSDKSDDFYKNTINVSNNKVNGATFKLDDSAQEYYVYFILEDEYGSVSTAVCNGSGKEVYALIPAGTFTKTAKTVTKVEMPNLEEVTALADAKATITTSDAMTTSDKFEAVLYKDGKPYATKEVTGASSGKTVQVALNEFKLVSSGSAITALEAGEYYMTVFGAGDTDTAPSATVESNRVRVTPIASVSNIEYTRYMEDAVEYEKLSWKTPHNKLDIEGYDLYVTSLSETANDYKEFEELVSGDKISDSQTVNAEDSSLVEVIKASSSKISKIYDNTLYKAYVVALAKTGHKLSEANSLPTVSREFFRLETPKVVTNSETSSEAILELQSISSKDDKDNTISGKVPTYSVEVYTLNPNYKGNSALEAKYIRASQYDQAVEVNKSSGRFTVKGLTGGTEYAIKLVATVQGLNGTVKGESGFVELGTKKAMFNIVDKIVTKGLDTRGGYIKATSTTVTIDDVDYTVSDYVELAKVSAIVQALEEGDHITYSTATPNEVSIAIATTDTSATPRTLPAAAKDMVVNITGNAYNQKLASTGSSEPAQVNITGTPGGVIDISSLNAKDNRIVITNANVKVGTSKDVVVAANSTVTFANTADFYTVTASKETPVNVEDKALTVTRTSANATCDLTVKDFPANLTLTVAGDGTLSGNVTLNGKGNVTVTPSVTVASSLNVTTVDGFVNLSAAGLTGPQSVTVTYKTDPSSDNTVKAFATEDAPFGMSGLELKYYDYNNDDDKLALISKISDVKVEVDKEYGNTDSGKVEDVDATKANFKLVNDYLAKFNLTGNDNNGKSVAKYGATITVDKDSNKVTITFTKATNDAKGVAQPVTIGGLR